MNKFEQVSSDHHQILLAGLMSRGEDLPHLTFAKTGKGGTLPDIFQGYLMCNLFHDVFDVTFPQCE